MAISRRLLNEGEAVVVSTRTHPKALLGPLLLLVVILGAAVLVSRLVDAGAWVDRVVWAVALAAALWLVVAPFLAWMATSYTVTSRRLITRTGVLTRRGHDIPLARISDVAYEHGPVDRLLGCGTLVVSDASTHGSVLLHDIPRVEDTHRQITQLLHELHDRRTGNE